MVTIIKTDGSEDKKVTVKHMDTIFCLQDRLKTNRNIVKWVIKPDGRKQNNRALKEATK